MARVSTTIGDPLSGGIGQPDPIILPEPASLFARRATRLRSLAEGHPMADWLRFVARLADAQQAAAALPQFDAIDTSISPPLDAVTHRRDACWRDALAQLIRSSNDMSFPEQVRAIVDRLGTIDVDALADTWLSGSAVPASHVGEALYVVAALQVYFAHCAATLPTAELHLLPQRGRCPVCGCPPVAGMITAAGKAVGARYLHCGLCATAWNHVRAVCINCGESGSLVLHEIDGGNGAVKAETCDACRLYAKMFYQAQDMQIEPMADDLASLGLDMLVGEAGWSRHAPNPLILSG